MLWCFLWCFVECQLLLMHCSWFVWSPESHHRHHCPPDVFHCQCSSIWKKVDTYNSLVFFFSECCGFEWIWCYVNRFSKSITFHCGWYVKIQCTRVTLDVMWHFTSLHEHNQNVFSLTKLKMPQNTKTKYMQFKCFMIIIVCQIVLEDSQKYYFACWCDVFCLSSPFRSQSCIEYLGFLYTLISLCVHVLSCPNVR